MTDEENSVRMVLDHIALNLERARAAYLDKLDAALQCVVDDAYKPARKGRFAEPTDYERSVPGERLSRILESGGHVTAFPASGVGEHRRLNRSDLRAAAEQLGLLEVLPL